MTDASNNKPVPHVRVVMPVGMPRGRLSAGRGAQFYITLPGQAEVKADWLTGAKLSLAMDDLQRVSLVAFATLEIEYEEEAG